LPSIAGVLFDALSIHLIAGRVVLARVGFDGVDSDVATSASSRTGARSDEGGSLLEAGKVPHASAGRNGLGPRPNAGLISHAATPIAGGRDLGARSREGRIAKSIAFGKTIASAQQGIGDILVVVAGLEVIAGVFVNGLSYKV